MKIIEFISDHRSPDEFGDGHYTVVGETKYLWIGERHAKGGCYRTAFQKCAEDREYRLER